MYSFLFVLPLVGYMPADYGSSGIHKKVIHDLLGWTHESTCPALCSHSDRTKRKPITVPEDGLQKQSHDHSSIQNE